MAKHGVITIDAEGVPTLEARGGVFNYVADATTTIVSHQKVPVGYPALIQRAMLFAAGNVVAYQSTTGRIGMGALGKNYILA